jgi:hypothetical protein
MGHTLHDECGMPVHSVHGSGLQTEVWGHHVHASVVQPYGTVLIELVLLGCLFGAAAFCGRASLYC